MVVLMAQLRTRFFHIPGDTFAYMSFIFPRTPGDWSEGPVDYAIGEVSWALFLCALHFAAFLMCMDCDQLKEQALSAPRAGLQLQRQPVCTKCELNDFKPQSSWQAYRNMNFNLAWVPGTLIIDDGLRSN